MQDGRRQRVGRNKEKVPEENEKRYNNFIHEQYYYMRDPTITVVKN